MELHNKMGCRRMSWVAVASAIATQKMVTFPNDGYVRAFIRLLIYLEVYRVNTHNTDDVREMHFQALSLGKLG